MQELVDKLNGIKNEFYDALKSIKSVQKLDDLRVQYLGKKGSKKDTNLQNTKTPNMKILGTK